MRKSFEIIAALVLVLLTSSLIIPMVIDVIEENKRQEAETLINSYIDALEQQILIYESGTVDRRHSGNHNIRRGFGRIYQESLRSRCHGLY